MTRDELKEKLAKQLYEWIDDDGWEWREITKTSRDVYRVKATSILSLIDAERCVWTLISNEMGSDFYRTSCGEASFVLNKYCRYCGKRIEVKEVKDGQ